MIYYLEQLFSYRTIPFADPEKVKAALSRRIFAVGDEVDTVDYSHRTIAEYLAAKWLADKIRQGLPLGRLRSLLGFEGYPSSELRGLHAWLAVFLPESAYAFIKADPYGILTYGDAASLSSANKQKLLIALSELSKKDPWFRSAGLYSPLNGFVDNTMAPLLHQMLTAYNISPVLRMIVLESLSASPPIQELKNDLIDIVKSESMSYSKREEALTALIHLSEIEQKSVIAIYHNLTGDSSDDIRLRSHIIRHLYNSFFSPKDIHNLLISALYFSDEKLPIGTLWSIVDIIPSKDIPAIFDELYRHKKTSNEDNFSVSLNYNEVYFIVENLLLRLFEEHYPLSAKQIWQYFSIHNYHAHSNYSYYKKNKNLQQHLLDKQALFSDIIDEAIDSLDDKNLDFSFLYNLKGNLLGVITHDVILARLINYISINTESTPKSLFIYKLSFVVLFTLEHPPQTTFEFLLEFGEYKPDFLVARKSVLICEVDNWRQEKNQRDYKKRVEKNNRLIEDKANFDRYRNEIISASHLGWLHYISHIYFSLHYDVDENSSPIERLASSLGEENVPDAIKGLIATLTSPDLPTLDNIINTEIDGKYYPWWYAILAGSDEAWKVNPDITIWDDDLLQTLLALELRFSTFIKEGNKQCQYQREWKKRAIEKRLDIFIKTYFHIIDVSMAHKCQHISALNYFINKNPLPLNRLIPAIFKLINKYPNNSSHIGDLLEFLLAHPETYTDLEKIVDKTITNLHFKLDEKCYQAWLASYYLLSPERCQEAFELIANENPDIIWLIRRLSGSNHRGANQQFELSLKQLETIITTAAIHFPNTTSPRSSSGTRNIWDGAELIKGLINTISAIATQQAGESLTRLRQLPQLSTYEKPLLHALSNQQTRRRESLFQQPDWRKAILTLSNQAPASVADLHQLIIDQLKDIAYRIANENSDIYKLFWNEDQYGRVEKPKSEESCCKVLIDYLRAQLQPLGIICEPEGHMAADKRADIVIQYTDQKVPIELKRDYHRDVWTAALTQLDRLYTRDPYSVGYGIYAVFWFGEKRAPNAIPKAPNAHPQPTSAKSMEEMLNETIPAEKQSHIFVIVIDVSGELP
ncbi:conserved hypothetical protein [Enterobacterales bacterium 8AC]|nr:conserved hypothetical protein [Enterobacterales bacterium 8AC]